MTAGRARARGRKVLQTRSRTRSTPALGPPAGAAARREGKMSRRISDTTTKVKMNLTRRKITERSVLPLVQRNVSDVLRSGVLALRPDQPIVRELLHDVSGPARDPRHGEHRREQLEWNAERAVGGGGVEVDVGIEALLGAHGGLEPLGDRVPAALPGPLAQRPRHDAQVRRPRVLRLVHRVPEAHELALRGE